LDPCSKCNQELFLYELKKPFTALICGHIFHRSCLEDYVKDLPQCPKCAIEIEPIVNTPSTTDLMQISPQIASGQSQDTIISEAMALRVSNPDLLHLPLYPDYMKPAQKRPSGDTSKVKLSSKKVKKQVNKEDSPTLKKLIQELSTNDSGNTTISRSESTSGPNTNSINFLNLYQKIVDSEDINKKTSQDVILSYFHFGKALEDRFNHYRKTNPKRTAQGLVNNEVRTQLPEIVSESLLRKTKERAQKIYDIFNEIGIDKIQRIRSFTATTIANISQDDIDFVLAKLSILKDK
ncbi:17079_t:CDS:1, partial [Gigaspora margarita]